MIIRLMGGLGNQMYQYAYGCYLENKGIAIKYNLEWFDKNKSREFGLKHFKCKMQFTDGKWTESGDHGKYHYLKYTDPVKERLKKELVINTGVIDGAAIHVRRGDYVNHPRFPDVGMSYYTQALSKINAKHHYVFSDDLDWCRKNLPQKFVYVDDPDYICFDMIRRCKIKIIANSTFSWWAAYLGEGKVIAPSQWFTDMVKQKRAINQIPSTWQII